ncbi:MAG TPA: hypothetical protein VFE65_27850 [Pseudonocardia sp.]|nr:hypothetical protein [Pseudonocardia sp.]
MSLVKSARKKRSGSQLEQLGADALDVIVATGGRLKEGIRAQVDELPGRVAELDLPGRVAELDLPGKVAELDLQRKVADARRELAARIEPTPEPRARGRRRRILWIGLFVAAIAGTAWAALNRRTEPELPPVAPVTEPPILQPDPAAVADTPAPKPAAKTAPKPSPTPKAKTNGSAPSTSSSARSSD